MSDQPLPEGDAPSNTDAGTAAKPPAPSAKKTGETGGPNGPEPTRYGDWERKGRCIDF